MIGRVDQTFFVYKLSSSPKIVLKVVKQCVGTDGVEMPHVKTVILGEFFKAYWNRRMALDRRNYKQLVQTTVEIAQKVGGSEIINNIVEDLRNENESYRKVNKVG